MMTPIFRAGWLATTLALPLLWLPLRAEEPKPAGKPAPKSAAERFVEIFHTEESARAAGRAIWQPKLRNFEKQGYPLQALAEIREVSEAFYARMAVDAGLRRALAGFYAELFTEAELEDLVRFYGSATGKKARRLASEITAGAVAREEDYARRNSAAYQKQIEAILEKYPAVPPEDPEAATAVKPKKAKEP